ncbi:hypothetical protein LNK15_15155, partial [Jeotgalicoccus huakuii]|nr:hypothetical protein [Jeotgalicoccus huakuii]
AYFTSAVNSVILLLSDGEWLYPLQATRFLLPEVALMLAGRRGRRAKYCENPLFPPSCSD